MHGLKTHKGKRPWVTCNLCEKFKLNYTVFLSFLPNVEYTVIIKSERTEDLAS